MPYTTSSADSLLDAQARRRRAGHQRRHDRDHRRGRRLSARRARCRSAPPRQRDGAHAHARAVRSIGASLNALPIGTGNKTERLMGYFTWHADDTPPVNPIGDLFKTQVWALARHLGVPVASRSTSRPAPTSKRTKPTRAIWASRISTADRILSQILAGYRDEQIARAGFEPREIALVRRRVEGTHWKRHLPTTALRFGTRRSTNSTCVPSTTERDGPPPDVVAAGVFSGRLQPRRPPLRRDRRAGRSRSDRKVARSARSRCGRDAGCTMPMRVREDDVADAFFVISTPQDAALSARLRALADRHRFLLCAIDQPALRLRRDAGGRESGPGADRDLDRRRLAARRRHPARRAAKRARCDVRAFSRAPRAQRRAQPRARIADDAPRGARR